MHHALIIVFAIGVTTMLILAGISMAEEEENAENNREDQRKRDEQKRIELIEKYLSKNNLKQ
jgi:CHASE3 domain sensor protein